MGLFSIFEKKKPIREIVIDYAGKYNAVVNNGGSSVDGFKKLAQFAFSEARRTRTTIHTDPESAKGWFFFKIEDLTGKHNDDRDLIKSYIFNAIASSQKHFWEPVSNEKMNLLTKLIEEIVSANFSNASNKFKEQLEKTSQAYNDAMIFKKKNAIEALREALDFSIDNGYADAEEDDIEDAMKKYTDKIMTIVNFSPTEAGMRKVIIDSISDFAYLFFYESLQVDDVTKDDIVKVVDSVLFH